MQIGKLYRWGLELHCFMVSNLDHFHSASEHVLPAGRLNVCLTSRLCISVYLITHN